MVKILPKANFVFQAKYGYEEAVFLTQWVEGLIQQIKTDPKFYQCPFEFSPLAEFNINQFKKENPFWTVPRLRKTLDNLKKYKILDYRIHKPDIMFWLLDHESLIKEIQDV